MSTCSDIENFAIVFDVLGDDVSEVGPVLVPVELCAISFLFKVYSAYLFYQKGCLP